MSKRIQKNNSNSNKFWMISTFILIFLFLVSLTLLLSKTDSKKLKSTQVLKTIPLITTNPTISSASEAIITPLVEEEIKQNTPVITFDNQIKGYVNYQSKFGYSLNIPESYTNIHEDGNTTTINDGMGGYLVIETFTYLGGSRRVAFQNHFAFDVLTSTYSDVLVDGLNGLQVEVTPKGDSGSGTHLLLVKGSNMLVISWPWVYQDDVKWQNMLKGIKLNKLVYTEITPAY